jgi:transcription elongation factor GreA
MEKVPMTQSGHARLEAELKTLVSSERPAVIEAIAEARGHGDLKENAEYQAARERQSFIEGRIQELEAALSMAQIIDVAALAGSKAVKFGATVTIADEESGEEKTIQIVGAYESDADNGKISLTSPIARALIGKTEGDSVAVTTPKGQVSYEILAVTYI